MTDYDDVSDTIHLQGLGSALPTFASIHLFLLRGITKIPPAAPLQKKEKIVSGKRGILTDSAK
jgi:hypothetical protein